MRGYGNNSAQTIGNLLVSALLVGPVMVAELLHWYENYPWPTILDLWRSR